jgi:NitT/TauT family transport system substrate-binding protein
MRNLNGRLVALLAVAAATLVGGCGGDDSSTAEEGGGGGGGAKISVANQDLFSHMPVYAAVDQGFMEKHGISEVEFVEFTDLPAMTAAVSRGQVDIGYQTPIAVTGYNQTSKSSPFQFISPGAKPTFDFMAREGSGIPPQSGDDWQSSVQAWKGKSVGVAALGGVLDLTVRYMVKEAGLAEDDVEILAVGQTPALVAAFKADQIQVTAGDSIIGPVIEEAGTGSSTIDFNDGQGPTVFKDTFVSAYFAPEERISAEPEIYAGFKAAVEEAQDWLMDPANEAAVAELIVEKTKVSPSIAKSLAPTMDQFDLQLDEATYDRAMNAFTAIGALKGPAPAYSELVANPSEN